MISRNSNGSRYCLHRLLFSFLRLELWRSQIHVLSKIFHQRFLIYLPISIDLCETYELFLFHFRFEQIRTAGIVFYSLCNNAVAFVGDKFFPILLELIFLHGVLIFLAFNCIIGMILVAFMKETRGNSLDKS